MKIIINAIAAKKHAGGAFQISKNFILESLQHPEVEWYWIVSKDLDEVISDNFADMKGKRYFAFPTQPDFLHSYLRVRKQLAQIEKAVMPDLIYSILAPSYFRFKTCEVMRFTKPWATHPNKYSWALLSPSKRRSKKREIVLQRLLIKKCKYFITQSRTCKEGIIRITGTDENNVKVISNVLPAAYRNAERTHIINDDNWINVACIGNPYPHKNFDILPEVLDELRKLGIENVRFHVTIPQDHPLWSKLVSRLDESGLSGRIITHGRCTQDELIDVYRRCQLCYQPTVLEVFSASAIEAMFFRLPTVASNMPFNSEVFEDSCLYYEPRNAKHAALQFKELMNNSRLQEDLVEKMEKRLMIYGNYDNHFNDTKDFLIQIAKNNCN